MINFKVVLRDAIRWVGVDEFEIELIGLCYSSDSGGARVALIAGQEILYSSMNRICKLTS